MPVHSVFLVHPNLTRMCMTMRHVADEEIEKKEEEDNTKNKSKGIRLAPLPK
jgi:hypothetical protein